LVPGTAPQEASAPGGSRGRRNAASEASVGNATGGRGGDGGRIGAGSSWRWTGSGRVACAAAAGAGGGEFSMREVELEFPFSISLRFFFFWRERWDHRRPKCDWAHSPWRRNTDGTPKLQPKPNRSKRHNDFKAHVPISLALFLGLYKPFLLRSLRFVMLSLFVCYVTIKQEIFNHQTIKALATEQIWFCISKK
jgi:hypothetical protein